MNLLNELLHVFLMWIHLYIIIWYCYKKNDFLYGKFWFICYIITFTIEKINCINIFLCFRTSTFDRSYVCWTIQRDHESFAKIKMKKKPTKLTWKHLACWKIRTENEICCTREKKKQTYVKRCLPERLHGSFRPSAYLHKIYLFIRRTCVRRSKIFENFPKARL